MELNYNVRKFKLTNDIGQTLSLNDLDTFAYRFTEGLGISFTNNYINYGSTFIPEGQVLNQGQMNLNMLFSAITGHSYKRFYEFVQFLNFQPYVLEYTTEIGTFQRACQLNELTKTELNTYGVLDESMVIDFITPWYKIFTNEDMGEGAPDDYPIGVNKIYQDSSENNGSPVTRTDLIHDGIISEYGSGTPSDGIYWYRNSSGNINYSIVESPQYINGYNIFTADTSGLNFNSNDVASFRYYHGDTSNLSDGQELLLDLYIKADGFTGNFELKLESENGNLLNFDIVDSNGSKLHNSATGYYASYDLASDGLLGKWVNVKVKFNVDSSDMFKSTVFDFIGPRETVYITGAKLLWLNESIESGGPYYYMYNPYYIYGSDEDYSVTDDGTYFTIHNKSLDFNVTGNSPIVITIEAIGGDVVNPSWELYRGSTLLQSDGFFLTIPNGSRLVVSSFPENQLAQLYNPNGDGQNVYQNQDLTKTNFITIPKGDSTLIFDVGSGRASFSFREEYLII